MRLSAAFAALACLLAAAPAGAQKGVVVVLSSDMRPYQAAYESFREAFGDVPVLYPEQDGVDLPKETKVVVAFGGKAAAQPYPSRVALVYGVAPGLVVGPGTHDGPNVSLRMVPAPQLFIGRLKTLQPGLKKLAVLWSGEGFVPIVEDVRKEGRAAGIEIISTRIEDSQALPGLLRSLRNEADALWLLPDPALVIQGNFGAIRDFSYGSGVVFYAPTSGLVEQGAVACVAPTFGDIGRAAAEIAKKELDGKEVPANVYLPSVETTVNLRAAKRIGLTLPAAALETAKIVP